MSAVSSWRWSFEEEFAFWTSAGIDHVGLSLRKCEEVGLDRVVACVRDAGLRVADVGETGWCVPRDPATWPGYRDRLLAAIDLAAALGWVPVVITTGPADGLVWEEAAQAFGEMIEPVADAARHAHVAIAIENTSGLRLDLSFATTLADALLLAERFDVSACVEINSCWHERALGATLLAGKDRLAHVQMSDVRVGSTITPDRLVPGDGDIPLTRVLRAILAAGYRGAFELELVGPAIEAEGYASVIPRAVSRAGALLSAVDC